MTNTINQTEESTVKPRALLLGMIYSEEYRPKRGQEFRDRVRCEALESLGYDVYTTDNKHETGKPNKHISADFCDPRRMLKAIQAQWGSDVKFDYIILDYFFSPVCIHLPS